MQAVQPFVSPVFGAASVEPSDSFRMIGKPKPSATCPHFHRASEFDLVAKDTATCHRREG